MARSMFRNSALLSGLVSQDQVDAAVAALYQSPVGTLAPLVEADDAALAAKLVEMGALTKYQAEQIRAGRTKLNLGPYIITDFIGQGGMGQVYKGVHQVMGRDCAVKVLPLHKSTPDAVNNFMREIRTQAQLDHPNLVRAYDAGRDGDVHYLVTEFISGTDLRRLVRSQGPLTQQQAASVVLQAAKALDHAHKRGLIHRDVKPGNILVTPQGVAKVSDLGLAGYMHEADSDPRSGKIVGTADYLSPEQIRNPLDVSQLSDIYSLGCTLYYAVCGKVPFPGGTARDKARRHCEETPWHPRRFNLELHEEFVDVIADMMEKNPAERIQSAEEVVARLEQWAGETSPIGQRWIRSQWSAPPLIATAEDAARAEIGQDTDGGDVSGSADQASQYSQGTASLKSPGQETSGPRKPRPSPAPHSLTSGVGSPLSTIAVTLAIAVPLSMFAGAVLASLLFWALR
jgi:eukaryotic-like serine/threonine-protein kinase